VRARFLDLSGRVQNSTLLLFIHPGWSVYCTQTVRQLLRGRDVVESGSIELRSRYFSIGQAF